MSIYKKVCDALGISRKELADKLGISKATIDSWSDSSRISNTAQVALELMIENHSLSNIVGKIKRRKRHLMNIIPAIFCKALQMIIKSL